MIGYKLEWTGLGIAVILPPLLNVPAAAIVGAVLFAIGCVLMWLDR